MTNFYQGLARGPIDHNASSVINGIANDAIEMGSAVKLLSSISPSELLPRVLETALEADVPYGIVVGGDNDGIYSTTGAPIDDTTKATTSAKQGVVIVTQGRCLARVDGNADAIVIGSPLAASATAGILVLGDAATQIIVARALQPSTGATDIIAVDVQREGLFT